MGAVLSLVTECAEILREIRMHVRRQERDVLTVSDVASMLSVTENYLRTAIVGRGLLRAYTLTPGKKSELRFLRSDVIEYLKSEKHHSASQCITVP